MFKECNNIELDQGAHQVWQIILIIAFEIQVEGIIKAFTTQLQLKHNGI